MHLDNIDLSEVLACQNAILRNDFSSFLMYAFKTSNPGQPFIGNWHIDLLAETLERVRCGEIKRVIFNLPPRSLKSHIITVCWPAFILGHQPDARIIAASYASAISLKHSADTRHLMQSEWYMKLFPSVKLQSGENQKQKFLTRSRGFRLAVSVGGSVTGEGGDFLIVDDPLNPVQAMGLKTRSIANRWFDYTFSTRLNDKKNGAMVVVMQRLHPDDLTGHLLKKGGWEHIAIPAIATEEKTYHIGYMTYRRPVGELLHPQREDAAALERARSDLGPVAYAAQYQQAPVQEQFALIKMHWFGRYDGLSNTYERIIQSWDTAIKIGASNDASAGITFGLADGKWHILDVTVLKQEYTQLKRTIQNYALRFKPQQILIEDKASGQSLLQDFRSLTHLPVVSIKPKGDKALRLASVTSYLESGKVVLPIRATWLHDFERELLEFPGGIHDDQVDALSQFLHWLRNQEYVKPSLRSV
jgi:predicted phage terminase large subunit-like protein